MAHKWTELTPRLPGNSIAYRTVLECAKQLKRVAAPLSDGADLVQDVRAHFLNEALSTKAHEQVARVLISALCDLRAQGWELRVRNKVVHVRKPTSGVDPAAEKERVRLGLLVERDRQLREPAVRRFIHSMERRRLGPSGWVSIYSLMRDGSELAARLAHVKDLPPPVREVELATLIQPYLQEVDDGRCEHTGLLLKEIWRYFRHTWVTPHKTVPGRNLWFLIRDAAAPFHPVIGIAGLGSAFVQMGVRDDWIGWSSKQFMETLREQPTQEWAEWLDGHLTHITRSVFAADFKKQGVLSTRELRRPRAAVIVDLLAIAQRAREKHRRYGSAGEHKGSTGGRVNWRSRAMTPLFVSKRAETLADLLQARLDLLDAGFTAPTAECLARALETTSGRRAIARVLRRVKGANVGHDLLDIIVCGAVSPYREILGGKLVAMLMASPEVTHSYVGRYSTAPNVIASSMAGRAISRVPRLVMLGTTSLYGVGSSQYNRIRIPADKFDAAATGQVTFKELGYTEGYGSFHFSDATLQEIRTLVAQRNDGRPVRYIFGEGVNPRLREVRGALEDVGLPSDELLQHGTPRIVYGIELARNAREVLLGLDEDPEYVLPQEDPRAVTHEIARYWISRWVVGRVQRPDVLRSMSRHKLQYPIEHGARVVLPMERGGAVLTLDV